MRSRVSTTVNIRMMGFWILKPCNAGDINRRVRGNHWFCVEYGRNVSAVGSFKTTVTYLSTYPPTYLPTYQSKRKVMNPLTPSSSIFTQVMIPGPKHNFTYIYISELEVTVCIRVCCRQYDCKRTSLADKPIYNN